MNVQYVIDRALADAAGRSETATRELAPVGSSSADITKLAAALNFIGANLEASVPTPSEIMAQAELTSMLGVGGEKVAASKKQQARRLAYIRAAQAEQVARRRQAIPNTAPTLPSSTAPVSLPQVSQGQPGVRPDLSRATFTPMPQGGPATGPLRSGVRSGLNTETLTTIPQVSGGGSATGALRGGVHPGLGTLTTMPQVSGGSPATGPLRSRYVPYRTWEYESPNELGRLTAPYADSALRRHYNEGVKVVDHAPPASGSGPLRSGQTGVRPDLSRATFTTIPQGGPVAGPLRSGQINPALADTIPRSRPQGMTVPMTEPSGAVNPKLQEMRARQAAAQAQAEAEVAARRAQYGTTPDNGIRRQAKLRQRSNVRNVGGRRMVVATGGGGAGGGTPSAGRMMGGGGAGGGTPSAGRMMDHIRRNAGRYAAGAGGLAALGGAAYMLRRRNDDGQQKSAGLSVLAPFAISGGLGYAGGEEGRRKLREAGLSEDLIAGGGMNALGGVGRQVGYGAGGSVLGGLGGGLVGGTPGVLLGSTAGNLLGAMYGNYRGYKAPIEEAERIIAERGGRQKKASALMLAPHAIAGGLGYAGGEEGRRKLRGAGLSEDAISGGGINALGGMGRHLGYGAGGTALGALAGGALGGDVGALTGGLAGNAIGGLYGMYRGYKAPIEEAERIIAERGGRQKKAHFKLAEDAINPARISAGPAPAFSGEIMPAASPVFGGQTDPSQLIAMKAQKVRDRINADMRAYVSETGEGYNLDGHLSIFNK